MGNRAWDMITVRNQMQDSMKGQFGDYQKGVIDPLRQSYADYGGKIEGQMSSMMGEYDPLISKMSGMMNDESQRGYSQDVQNAMYGKQAEALTGAKNSYLKNMGKTMASQGLGGASSGTRNRMLNEYEQGHASNLRAASRDVKLADAEAKRADLWSSVQGLGSALSGKSNTAQGMMGLGLNALQGQGQAAQMGMQNMQNEQSFWDSMANQSQAYSGVKNNESGFWKSFKQGFGSSLGGFLGNPMQTIKPKGF